MNKLDLQIQLLKETASLTDEQAEKVRNAMRTHTCGALNAGQILIAKKADPITMRALIEEHGVTYNGTKKSFQ